MHYPILLLISYFFHLIPTITSFSINGNEWRDLEWQSTYFQTEFNTFTTDFSNGISSCTSITVAGGTPAMNRYNYLEKTYSDVPTHNVVYINFMYYRIDSLDQDDGIRITIDGTTSYDFESSIDYSSSIGSQTCGHASWSDQPPILIIIVYPSSSSSIKIRLDNMCDQTNDDENVGFRDITLVFKNSPTTPSAAQYAVGSYITQASYPCSSNNYLQGTCKTCDSSCKECYGGANTDCYLCSDGYYHTGLACEACGLRCRTCTTSSDKSCTSCIGNNYLYPDNSCQTSCVSPKVSTGGPPYTCNCKAGEYLHVFDGFTCSTCQAPFVLEGQNCYNPCGTGLNYYANGTCRFGCPSPFYITQNYTAPFCNFPCKLTEYYFSNGTCSTWCPQYYIRDNITVSAYCKFPCTSSQFLFDNGTCLDVCNSPNTVNNVIVGNECNFQCDPGLYMYKNLSCLPTCTFPFTIATGYITPRCNFPCQQNEYYYANGTCMTTCPSPFIKVNISVSAYCNFPCALDQYYYPNQTCRSSCPTSFVADNISVSAYCNFKCPLTEFYYTNGSCLSTCPSPFYSSSITIGYYCNFPCPVGQYYYENTSCINSCNPPFIIDTITIGSYCNFICKFGRFYYQNGSCLSSCEFPFISIMTDITKVCNFPCPTGQYYYDNQTCLPSCNSPFTIRTISVGQYCDFPCRKNEYYYSDGSCQSTCLPPFLKVNISVSFYCNFPCAPTEFYFSNGSCLQSCSTPFLSSVTIYGMYCTFPCGNNTFFYQNGSCSTTCEYPFYISKMPGVGDYCNFLCDVGSFIYANNSCKNNCPSPFYSNVYPIEKFCIFPCPKSYYMYPDRSCKRTCPIPYVQTDISVSYYCNFPCNTGEFYYKNGSCLSSCPSPFYIENASFGNYCHFPCKIHEYYYQNQTCLPNCSNPFSSINVSVGSFCNFPCKSSEYYYSNGTCLSYCSGYPFYPINISVGNICKFPCKVNEWFYYNDTCQNSCQAPLKTFNVSVSAICRFPCAKGLFYYQNTTCLPSCTYPFEINDIIIGNFCLPSSQINQPYTIPNLGQYVKIASISTIAATVPSLIAGSNPYLSISFMALIQGFFFLLFFNVVYPPIILSVLGYFGSARLDFLPNPINWFIEEIPDMSSPHNFYVNQYTGFFLNTAGPSMMILFGAISVYAISYLFGKYLRIAKFTRLGRFILKEFSISVVLRIFVSIYSELLYASILQILQLNFNNGLKSASTISSFFAFLITTLTPWLLYSIIKQAKNFNNLKKYFIIIEDYDINVPRKRFFSFYLLLRKYIHCLAVALLYYSPIFQTLIPWTLNLCILIMLIIYRPHHAGFLNFMDILTEMGNFILHTCVVILAYYDTLGIVDFDKRQQIGWVMLVDIAIILLFSMLNVWREYLISIFRVFKSTKKEKKVINLKKPKFRPEDKYKTRVRLVENKKLWKFELTKYGKKSSPEIAKSNLYIRK